MAKAGKGLLEGTLQAGTSAVSDKLLDLVGLGGKSAADKGKDTRDYLAAAFPLSAADLPPSPTKSSNLSETAEVRSEERVSRNAETDLVCRLLLEKKKNIFVVSMQQFAFSALVLQIVLAIATCISFVRSPC